MRLRRCINQLPHAPHEWSGRQTFGEPYYCHGVRAVAGETATEQEHRQWALDNVRRNHQDDRSCGHHALTEGIDRGCMACAIELGRRIGHEDAGAVLLHDEAMKDVDARG